MILYLDTSALVKLYIKEPFSDVVNKASNQAKATATHVISFVETLATFARLQRENKLSIKQLTTLKSTFKRDWENYLQVKLTSMLIQQAANLAEAFALRAYDSVHLAAAHYLYKESKQPVTFACFDHKLNHAAQILELTLLEISTT